MKNRVEAHTADSGLFIRQHVSPLFFRQTDPVLDAPQHKDITSEQQFWLESGELMLSVVKLHGFKITDWFPRVPGLYWSASAGDVRTSMLTSETLTDPDLGNYFARHAKRIFVDWGGMGTIRLLPRRIDDVDCWFATALTGVACHAGIPLAIPHSVLRTGGVEWGDAVDLTGRVRFLRDAGLSDVAASVHGARPLIVFVDKIEAVRRQDPNDPIIIHPVVLFESNTDLKDPIFCAFVQCAAGPDSELDIAADWIRKYVAKNDGNVITNFDEQRPLLEDAPLSYQRLVANRYDRSMMSHFAGPLIAHRVEVAISQQTVATQYLGGTHVGNTINVGGSANVNINSTLSNVTQTIGSALGLDRDQKTKLDSMVESLKAELDNIKTSHADEAGAIADALQRTVTEASKAPDQRKKGLLQISANGLKEAATLVADVAPKVLATATLVADFIMKLHGH